MKTLKILSLSTLILIGSAFTVNAQSIDVKVGDETVKLTPTGRLYYDGATFIQDETELGNGTTAPDIRLGLKAKYKNFNFKVDIGFAKGAVSAKDVFVQYNFNKKSYVRGGHFAEPFGLDHMESSGSIKFMTANATSFAFSPGRKLGIEYIGWNKSMWFGGGLFGDGDAMKNSKKGDDGYSATARLVYNPLQAPGKIFHVGLSGSLRKADANGYNSPKEVIYSSAILNNVDKVTAIKAVIDDANYQAKYAAELVAAAGPVFFQGEYFHTNVKRKNDLATYTASGAYAQIGLLAIGGDYSYSASWARLGSPKPKSLEFVLRYNYTDLNDSGAGVAGGRMSDYSFAANYYLNKFITFRVNYSYLSMGKNSPLSDENIQIIQGRIQLVF